MERNLGHGLRLDHIVHHFGDFTAVRDCSLEIKAGELVALLGPSGCGKSTLLKIISGFIAQSGGRVLFDGKAVDHLPPASRGVGIVFQNYALFPHMTVAQNVAYGLEAQKWPREKIAPRVEEMLALVHMSAFAARKPSHLSGGQQQRVALARCLAVDPKILLLDEPFGALDKNLRLDMQIEVKRLQRVYGITTVLVTHDQEEALSMADRVAVMNRGVIEQIAPPTEIYDRPATPFVNSFVGTTNLLAGEVEAVMDGQAVVRVADGILGGQIPAAGLRAGQRVQVSLRPEKLILRNAPVEGALSAVVKAVLPLGPQIIYEVALKDETTVKIAAPRAAGSDIGFSAGQDVFLAAASAGEALIFVS